MDIVTTAQVAEQLGVSRQRVLHLCQSGDLDAVHTGGVWLIDSDSVHRRELLRRLGALDAARRPWSTSNAWAMMRVLDGDDQLVASLASWDRSRLRNRLARGVDRGEILAAVANRAHLVRVSVHPSRVAVLRQAVLPSGITGAGHHGHGLTGDRAVDGYLTPAALDEVRRSLRVRDSATGEHLLRVVAAPAVIAGLKVAPRLAVAADLLDHAVSDSSIDGRVVGIIERLLAQVAADAQVELAAGTELPTFHHAR